MKARTQVVLCRCCTEIPSLLKLDVLSKLASESDNVMSVITMDAVCDGKQLAQVMNDAKEKELDRAVVLACHKKDVSPALLKAYKRTGINEFMVELVNIREEVVLPHAGEPDRAQAKAEAKLRAALARCAMLQPLERQTEEMRTKNVLIVGAGVAGQAAAKEAAKAGIHTVILEKSGKTLKVPGVVMQHSTLVDAEGYGGNFTFKIKAGEKIEVLEAGAVVIATGGGWTQLKGPLAKAAKDAIPLYRLNEQLHEGTVPTGPIVVVDTPDPAGKTMAVQDFAWDEALETVLELKRKHPQTEVWVVFQEMRAFGLTELAYKAATDSGVKFIRYDKGGIPKVDTKNPGILSVKDFAHGEPLAIRFSTLVFASIPANPDNQLIAEALRIPMSADGGVRRGSMQRWPVATPKPGVFVCGSALFPKSREAAEAEGRTAGVMAGAFVKTGAIEFGGVVAEVEQEKCSACLTCVRTCPYEAPFIGKAGKAEIRTQGCQGCGMCVGICPSKAIELKNYTDEQISGEARTLLGGDF